VSEFKLEGNCKWKEDCSNMIGLDFGNELTCVVVLIVFKWHCMFNVSSDVGDATFGKSILTVFHMITF
jgi:hypothetical protein